MDAHRHRAGVAADTLTSTEVVYLVGGELHATATARSGLHRFGAGDPDALAEAAIKDLHDGVARRGVTTPSSAYR